MKHCHFINIIAIGLGLLSSSAWAIYCPSESDIQSVISSTGFVVTANIGDGQSYAEYKLSRINEFGTRSDCELKIDILANNKDEAVLLATNALSTLKNSKLMNIEDNWVCVYDIDQPADGQRHDLAAYIKL